MCVCVCVCAVGGMIKLAINDELWIVHAYPPRVIPPASVAPLLVRSLLRPNEPQRLPVHHRRGRVGVGARGTTYYG